MACRALVLTGPSASGKSSLARWLGVRGWQVLDGDALARGLYRRGSALLRRVSRAFGPGVLRPDGSLDRGALAAAAFASPARRRRLTRLVYPAFLRQVRGRFALARRSGRRLAADLAVYFDAGAPDLGAKVVLVDAPLRLRLARLKAKGLAPGRALAQARALRFGPKEKRGADLILAGSLPRAVIRRQLKAFLS